MGSTGDPPVPVGDPPTGRAWRLFAKDPSSLPRGALPIPPGEPPGGTGQWPVLPKREFPDRLFASKTKRRRHWQQIQAPAAERGRELITQLPRLSPSSLVVMKIAKEMRAGPTL